MNNRKKDLATDVNMCYDYTNKINLLTIANIISELSDAKINVLNPGLGKNYTGSGKKLAAMNLKLDGLYKGVEVVYRELLKSDDR